ncbi:MAG: acylphosphatase [Woeseiaceae bacterium]
MREARRFTIRGRVQGVWFRDSTRRQAEALALSGHAVNLANGDVEVLALGESSALDQLAKWLQTGPPIAKVASVEVETAEWSDINGFSIG